MFSLFSSSENDTSATTTPTADKEPSLLSGVASWFGYGGPANAVHDQAEEEVHFDTEDADHDWVLVDKRRPRSADEDMGAKEVESDEENSSLLEAVATATSTYQLDHEDDWIMTPLPCFTLPWEAPALMNSPYEDLLIEHPSMSIYDRFDKLRKLGSLDEVREEIYDENTPIIVLRLLKYREGGHLHMPVILKQNTGTCHVELKPRTKKPRQAKNSSPWAAQTQEGCQHRQENKLEIMARVKAVKSAQRRQQKKETQGLSHKHLQRQNKSLALQSLGKRATKNNRVRNTSGAMNSRIPQRRH